MTRVATPSGTGTSKQPCANACGCFVVRHPSEQQWRHEDGSRECVVTASAAPTRTAEKRTR